MEWEQQLIRILQGASNGFLDFIFLAITELGNEMFFIVVAVVLYWCVDKKFAYKFMNVYILSVASNEGIKSVVARRRPYLCEGIRSIGAETSGYSFPSGHSQSIANISAQINLRFDDKKYRKIFLPVGIAVTALVMFSRMYLGQHFLSDVVMGAALGFATAHVFGVLFDFLGDREELIVIVVSPLCLAIALVIASMGLSGIGNVMTVLGAYTAIAMGYFAEKHFVCYAVRSDAWWKYLIKTAVGIAVTLLIKECLKFVFPASEPLLYNYLRYFLVGIWASFACPLLFKLARL